MACFTKVPGLLGPGQRGRRCPQGACVKQHKAREAHGLGLEVELLNLVQRVKNDKTREHIAVTPGSRRRLHSTEPEAPAFLGPPALTCKSLWEALLQVPLGGQTPQRPQWHYPHPRAHSPTPVTEGPNRQAQGSEARVGWLLGILSPRGTTSVPSWLFPSLLGQGARRPGGGGTFLGEGKGRQTFGHAVRRSHSARLTVPKQAGSDAVGTASGHLPGPSLRLGSQWSQPLPFPLLEAPWGLVTHRGKAGATRESSASSGAGPAGADPPCRAVCGNILSPASPRPQRGRTIWRAREVVRYDTRTHTPCGMSGKF